MKVYTQTDDHERAQEMIDGKKDRSLCFFHSSDSQFVSIMTHMYELTYLGPAKPITLTDRVRNFMKKIGRALKEF